MTIYIFELRGVFQATEKYSKVVFEKSLQLIHMIQVSANMILHTLMTRTEQSVRLEMAIKSQSSGLGDEILVDGNVFSGFLSVT